MKTCVIIPAYNEAATIGGLIEQVHAQNLEAIVIDDGSSDSTAQIARERGAIVLRNETNLGKGASLAKGFDYALKEHYDAVITMDADGQHSVEEIPYFMRLAQYSDTALIVGNRMVRPVDMPFIRILTNKFMSWLISKIVKQNIPDTQCGFRLIKKEVLSKLKPSTFRFEIESEVLIQAARLGFKIESVNIKSIYAKEKSQINPLADTLRFCRFIAGQIWTTQS
jgi:glycosyltransferase involved in cell wall biosynthesis